MKLAILFLGWLVVGFVVALAIGKLVREVGLNVADDEYPDRRSQMRRASRMAPNAPPASIQEQRRREPDRRKGDDVPRKRR
jgi:hypothetical protein